MTSRDSLSPAAELAEEFPLLYDRSVKLDHDERLGYGTSKLMAEADAALREILDARRHLRDSE